MDNRQLQLERKMKKMFDMVDDYMEDKYDNHWRLHPNRLKRGKAANKEADGLFNIGAAFSPGFGTQCGRGYVIDLSVSTLQRIPFGMKNKLTKEAVVYISNLLPQFFKNRKLEIVKDGSVYKIIGDFSLGESHIK